MGDRHRQRHRVAAARAVDGLAAGDLLGPDLAAVAGTGFCGGYTTFSTATIETLRLAQRREAPLALLNAVGTTAATLVAAALGWWVGGSLGA